MDVFEGKVHVTEAHAATAPDNAWDLTRNMAMVLDARGGVTTAAAWKRRSRKRVIASRFAPSIAASMCPAPAGLADYRRLLVIGADRRLG